MLPFAGKIRCALFLAIPVALIAAACGGDDDDGGGIDPFGRGDDPTNTATSGEEGGSGGDGGSASGGSTAEEPWLSSDQGESWAEVDGQRITWLASGSIHYACEITDSQIQVNYQTPDGNDLLIHGANQGDGWFGSFTFKSNQDEGNVQYGGDLAGGDARLGVGDGTLSYEGTISRVEDFDVVNAEDVMAAMAVNCDSGIELAAEIDGQAYTFPVSGAQSVSCEITDDGFDIDISNVAEQLDFEAELREESGNLLGHVVVRSDGESYSSTIPSDGEGLEFSAGMMRYSGTFTVRSTDAEVEGTASASCP